MGKGVRSQEPGVRRQKETGDGIQETVVKVRALLSPVF